MSSCKKSCHIKSCAHVGCQKSLLWSSKTNDWVVLIFSPCNREMKIIFKLPLNLLKSKQYSVERSYEHQISEKTELKETIFTCKITLTFFGTVRNFACSFLAMNTIINSVSYCNICIILGHTLLFSLDQSRPSTMQLSCISSGSLPVSATTS